MYLLSKKHINISGLGTKTMQTFDPKSNALFSLSLKDKVIFYFEFP